MLYLSYLTANKVCGQNFLVNVHKVINILSDQYDFFRLIFMCDVLKKYKCLHSLIVVAGVVVFVVFVVDVVVVGSSVVVVVVVGFSVVDVVAVVVVGLFLLLLLSLLHFPHVFRQF